MEAWIFTSNLQMLLKIVDFFELHVTSVISSVLTGGLCFYSYIFCYMQAIHKLTEYLSFQVRNITRELVDAFDMPDHVIRAPIGKQTPVEAYSEYIQQVGFQ